VGEVVIAALGLWPNFFEPQAPHYTDGGLAEIAVRALGISVSKRKK
jgi:hypothetical protein